MGGVSVHFCHRPERFLEKLYRSVFEEQRIESTRRSSVDRRQATVFYSDRQRCCFKPGTETVSVVTPVNPW